MPHKQQTENECPETFTIKKDDPHYENDKFIKIYIENENMQGCRSMAYKLRLPKSDKIIVSIENTILEVLINA